MMSDLFEHFSNLSISSFMQSHFQPGIVSFLDDSYLRRRSSDATVWVALFGNGDSGAQTPKLIFSRLPRNFYQIGLGNVRGRFHQLVCQIAIVGQQQQAFAVEV
jgi:hypothetical protein